MRVSSRFGLVTLCLAALLSSATAKDRAMDEGTGWRGYATYSDTRIKRTSTAVETSDSDDLEIFSDAMDFAMHDASFTIYHEIGHLLIGELDLPVLGKEEDAADALGTLWLLEFDEAEDSYDALVSAADGWYYLALRTTGSSFEDFAYSADHTLDLHRAYAMVCFMVGKDRDVFGETADAYEIDADRQADCEDTYASAFHSWMKVLEPHITEGDEVSEYEVIYEDPGEYAEYAEQLKERGIIDIAAETIASAFTLPRPITFRVTQCGEANAYYYPAEGEIVYCYELADTMYTMYLQDIVGWGDTAN